MNNRLHWILLVCLLVGALMWGRASAASGPIALQNQQECAGPCAALGYDGYSWDSIQQYVSGGGALPAFGPEQTIVIVGKTDSGTSVSCNPCDNAQILAIYNYELPTIQAMLKVPGNLGQLWEVANEPQVTGAGGFVNPVESPSVYAYQWSLYAPLIRGLDPTAKLMSGAMLGIGAASSQGYCCDPSELQTYYYEWSLYLPAGTGPDYVGLDLYPSEANMTDAISVAEEDYASLAAVAGAKPIVVKEFGVNYSTADLSFAPTLGEDAAYMTGLVNFFKSKGVPLYAWFIGNDYSDWAPTSLEDNGTPTALAHFYQGTCNCPNIPVSATLQAPPPQPVIVKMTPTPAPIVNCDRIRSQPNDFRLNTRAGARCGY